MINIKGYLQPRTFDELWDAFEKNETPVVISAGCTDLIPKTRAGLLPPATWLDIRHIPELNRVAIEEDHLRLGACLTHRQVVNLPLVRKEYPALAQACRAVGSPQIRSLGTLGGNAANCSPCADSLLALAALDAKVVLRSSRGSRTLASTEFPRGPGESVLEQGELIESFILPRSPKRRSSFMKLGPRKAVSVAKVSAAASAHCEGNRLQNVRLVLGSVAPTLLRIGDAEALVEGTLLDDLTLRDVARIVRETVLPIDDVRSTADYRRTTSGVLAKRALRALLAD